MAALSHEDLGLLLARLLEATRSFTYIAQRHPITGVLTQLEVAQPERAQALLPLTLETTYGAALLQAVLPGEQPLPQGRFRCVDQSGSVHWLHSEASVAGPHVLGVLSVLPQAVAPTEAASIAPIANTNRPQRLQRNRSATLSPRELEEALTQNQLTLAYQLQLEPAPQRIVAAEVFLRWRHPVQGLLFPSRFVPLAEEFGLIRELSLWAAQTAAEQQRRWARLGFAFPLSLNLSPKALDEPSFVEALPAADFLLEVPAEALQQSETLAPRLHALARRGFVLGLDNAGLVPLVQKQLAALPLSFVKVARPLVQDLETLESAQAVRALVALARACQLTVIADGVETPEQASWLLAEGCHFLQGYLLLSAHRGGGAGGRASDG